MPKNRDGVLCRIPSPTCAHVHPQCSMSTHSFLDGAGHWMLVIIAAVLAMIALTTVIPPLSLPMLAVRIIATEGGTWLLVAAGFVVSMAMIRSVHRHLRSAAALLSVIAGVLVITPLFFLTSTIRTTDAEFARVCGMEWRDRLSSSRLGSLRPTPFSVRDSLLGIPSNPVVRTSLTLPSADGRTLAALRYGEVMPGMRRPIIVVIHGGGWNSGSIDECSSCQRYLADRGYLVYEIDYRFAPTTRFPGQLDDVRVALAWIAAHAAESGGDPARIVLMGRSAGAQLALVAAYDGRGPAVCGVVSWYGPTDLVGGYRELARPDPLDVPSLIGEYMGGGPDDEPMRYANASPIAYATHPLPPTLLIAGGSDHAVRIDFQRQLRDRLMMSGTTVVLLELPWAEHAFDRLADGPGAQLSLYYLERFLAWATTR
jgi:acetyl esterase/lipase